MALPNRSSESNLRVIVSGSWENGLTTQDALVRGLRSERSSQDLSEIRLYAVTLTSDAGKLVAPYDPTTPSPFDFVVTATLDRSQASDAEALTFARKLGEVDGTRCGGAWLVETFDRKRARLSESHGEVRNGARMVALMRPPTGKPRKQCVDHWLEHHAPLALEVHVGMAEYRQSVVVRALLGDGSDVFGISELYFATDCDLAERLFANEDGQKRVYADIPNFMSLDETENAILREFVL